MANNSTNINQTAQKESLGVIWMIYLIIANERTQAMMSEYANFNVMIVYTLMVMLLWLKFVQRYIKLRKESKSEAMDGLMSVIAILGCLIMAISVPSLIILKYGTSEVYIFFAGLAFILNLLMTKIIYDKHWVNYKHFVS